MLTRALLLVVALPSLAAEVSPEVQIALTSLRDGERARVEAALGSAAELPLYRGDFTLDPEKGRARGQVALTLFASPGRALRLRVTPNAAHPGAVVLSKVKVNGAPVAVEASGSLFTVALPDGAALPLTVELSLEARVPALPDAAPLSGSGAAGDYGAFSSTTDALSLVGLMPLVAPEGFGAPSGLGDLGTTSPSNFLVSVTAPTPWRVVANGQAVGEVPTGKGQTRFAYTVAAARDFPVVALKQPQVSTKKVSGVEIEAVLLSTDARHGAKVLRHTGELLQAYERRLGPYPYKTLRVVEQRLVSSAGGMEFPGLVTVSALLLSGRADPLAALGLGGGDAKMMKQLLGPLLDPLMAQTLEFTLAHELAHQYVGMLVGSDPVLEPIADEPLTQHLALLGLEWTSGAAAAKAMREGQVQGAYQLHRMMGGADGPAERPTGAYGSNQEYAALMYGKAPLLFDALRKLEGKERWEQLLRRYLDANRYRWVSASTFTDLVAAESKRPREVAALRQRWWGEAHGDEDLGGLNLSGMQLGGGGQLQLDPAMLKQLEEMMKMLGGE